MKSYMVTLTMLIHVNAESYEEAIEDAREKLVQEDPRSFINDEEVEEWNCCNSCEL